jgi:uncharacterized damage-inducible protein DinB
MSVFTNPASGSKAHAAAYTSAVIDLLGDQPPLDVLGRTEASLRQAIAGLTESELTAPESPGKWSVRHVVQHLADSELVWGWRLRMVLAHDRPPITGYDQDAWADRLGYERADAARALDEFAILRRANLRLLGRASRDDLARVGVHAERGDESVEHMMRLYAGHDLLHLRQLDRIRAAHGVA